MWLPRPGKTEAPQEVGLDRYYETMAFYAAYEDPYWEADIGRQVDFDSRWSIGEITRSSDKDADEMHEAVVTEISQRMKAGELEP